MRRVYVTLAVVAVVVLAGCSGLGGGTADYPDGYDDSGVVDGNAAIEAHQAGLEAATGFDASLEVTESGDGERSLEQRQLVDNENGLVLSRTTTSGSTQTSYQTADGVLYTRQETGGGVRYRQDDAGFGNSGIGIEDAVGLLESIEMESTTEERDGTTLYGFETDEAQDATFRDDEVTLESARLVVDEDGRIHSLSITATTGEGRETTIDADFDYGQVTVEEPDWLDEAKEATDDDF